MPEVLTCPKCGDKRINTKYTQHAKEEYLKRTCAECNYSWKDRCIDDNKKNKGRVILGTVDRGTSKVIRG